MSQLDDIRSRSDAAGLNPADVLSLARKLQSESNEGGPRFRKDDDDQSVEPRYIQQAIIRMRGATGDASEKRSWALPLVFVALLVAILGFAYASGAIFGVSSRGNQGIPARQEASPSTKAPPAPEPAPNTPPVPSPAAPAPAPAAPAPAAPAPAAPAPASPAPSSSPAQPVAPR
jgi:hypothetical protein